MTFFKSILLSVLVLLIFSLSAFAEKLIITDKDRITEVSLSYFDANNVGESCEEFVSRLLPLYQNSEGLKGTVICAGWLTSLFTEWTGNPGQTLPFLSNEMGSWEGRTYQDLRDLVSILRNSAAKQGMHDFNIGVLFVGYGKFIIPGMHYDFDNAWCDRHPEMYIQYGNRPVICLDATLKADNYPYAEFPDGLTEGTTVAEAYSKQWGSLSKFCEFDLLLLRDDFPGDSKLLQSGASSFIEHNEKVADFYLAMKKVNPEVLIMGYSSSTNYIRDMMKLMSNARFNMVNSMFDLEYVISTGAIDIWIDQTWGGAWNTWHDEHFAGCTNQLANILTHGAMIHSANEKRKNPCKHYILVNTWDGFELWDVLRRYPDVVRWETWAYTHAGTLTPRGLKLPDGAYVSWMNNFEEDLMSIQDISFVADNLDRAQYSASGIEKIYGPSLVYNRDGLVDIVENHTGVMAGERIDTYVGMVTKWGLPVSSSSCLKWINSVELEGLWTHIPNQPDKRTMTGLNGFSLSKKPMLISGHIDFIDKDVEKLCGVKPSQNLTYQRQQYFTKAYQRDDLGLLKHEMLSMPDFRAIELDGGEELAGIRESPLIIKSRNTNTFYWQPPFRQNDHSNVIDDKTYGTFSFFTLIAAYLNDASRDNNFSYLHSLNIENPVQWSYWKSRGVIYVLLGNLERGFIGDARIPKFVDLFLSKNQMELTGDNYVLENLFTGESTTPNHADAQFLNFNMKVAPNGGEIFKLVEKR